jgi:hypothetical protein
VEHGMYGYPEQFIPGTDGPAPVPVGRPAAPAVSALGGAPPAHTPAASQT